MEKKGKWWKTPVVGVKDKTEKKTQISALASPPPKSWDNNASPTPAGTQTAGLDFLGSKFGTEQKPCAGEELRKMGGD